MTTKQLENILLSLPEQEAIVLVKPTITSKVTGIDFGKTESGKDAVVITFESVKVSDELRKQWNQPTILATA